MRIAFFHDGDPRLPRLRGELEALGHEVLLIGPGASSSFLKRLFAERRPDVLHGLGRGPVALFGPAWWHRRLRAQGTVRVHDVVLGFGLPGMRVPVVDGSLPGKALGEAYQRLLA